MHFVQQLFFNGLQGDRTAGSGNFAYHSTSIWADFSDGKTKIPRLWYVFKTWVSKIAARCLRTALQNVANPRPLSKLNVIQRIPAELKHHRC